MEKTVSAILEKPATEIKVSDLPNSHPTTPTKVQKDTADAIGANLKDLGHSSDGVSASDSENITLAKIEGEGIGARALGLLDPLGKGIENMRGDVEGTNNTYLLKDGIGNEVTHRRMSQRVEKRGIAEKMFNLLAKRIRR